ncbi:hypothetical protein ACG2K1_02165 [Neisseria sp. 23W00296]|uniref:hypothetical protein n=1 Tax=unclassified Neisseria TaxID=2623750 RepID=UPI0037564290
MMVHVWTTVFGVAVAAAVGTYFWVAGSKAYNEMSDEERAEFKAKYNLTDLKD